MDKFNVAIECMAQLTRYVHRGDLTCEEAASLAHDLAEAFDKESKKRWRNKVKELAQMTLDENYGSPEE